MDDKAIIQAAYEAALRDLFLACFGAFGHGDEADDDEVAARFAGGFRRLLAWRQRALAIVSAAADSPASGLAAPRTGFRGRGASL